MRDFSLIQWHDHDQDTDTKSCDSSTRIEISKVLCGGLQRTTETEDGSSNHDRESTTKPISDRPGEESSKETTACEDSDDSTTIETSVS